MDIRGHVIHDLKQLYTTLEHLTPEQYAHPLQVLSHASVGAHVRHILEFYICLLRESDGIVNYDLRERSKKLELDLPFALRSICKISNTVSGIAQDLPLTLSANFSTEAEAPKSYGTTLFRELVYCLEHSVHHQAIIKIGFNELLTEPALPKNFGIAASTVRHQSAT